MKIHRRQFIVAAAAVAVACSAFAETPDAFLDYVESTGVQAVDTGIVGRYDTKAELKLTWRDVSGDTCLLGARGDDGTSDNNTRCYLVHANVEKVCHGYGFFHQNLIYVSDANNWQYLLWETDRPYTYVAEFAKTNETATLKNLTLDGRNVYFAETNALLTTGQNLYLFACNDNGTTNYTSKARIHACRIWQDRVLVRDFRPCLKDGRAGLYDDVSKEIFYSNTGTDLVYDPTYNQPDFFVDYVESDKYAYVDTGVSGRSGVRCETDMEWLDLGGDYAFLNARSTGSSNDRVFLLHSYNNGRNVGYGTFKYGSGSFAVKTRYHVESELKSGTQSLVVDGVSAYSGTDAVTYDTGLTLFLFANNIAGVPNNLSRARVYSLKLWLDDVLVRDYRPCVKYGRAALYDDVNKEICYPARGSLIHAPIIETAEPDYFLEYVDSPELGYIDTGVRARSGTHAYADVRWNRIYNTTEMNFTMLHGLYNGGEQSILAACAGDGGKRFYLLHVPYGDVWSGYGNQRIYPTYPVTNVVTTVTTNEVEVEGVSTQVVTTNTTETVNEKRYRLSPGSRHTYDVNYEAGAQTLVLDGKTILATNCADTVDAGGNLYLFANNKGGTATYFSQARLYALTLWQDGVRVRDFRPCFRNGKAGLYESVEHRIYYTSKPIESYGHPVYVEGSQPVKTLEYVDSDGTQWVDTGVIGRPDVVAEFEMQWLNDTSSASADVEFLGARKDATDTRFYLWHYVNTWMSLGYGIFVYPKVGDPSFFVSGWHGGQIHAEVDHTYHVKTSLLDGSVKMVVDDQTIVDYTQAGLSVDTGLPLYIFGCNDGGRVNYRSRARLYWLKIWQDGRLVRHFVPVLLDCGLPALWDKVNDCVYTPNVPFAAAGPVTGDVLRNRATSIFVR